MSLQKLVVHYLSQIQGKEPIPISADELITKLKMDDNTTIDLGREGIFDQVVRHMFFDKEGNIRPINLRMLAQIPCDESREIEGKILTPHPHIKKAYVYSQLSEIPNNVVWSYLLRGDGKSAWNTDNAYLYSLYQGETLGEEDSVIGQVDKDEMKVSGNKNDRI